MKNKELDEVLPKPGSDPMFPCDEKTVIGQETYTFEDEHGATQFGSRNVFGTIVYKGLSQRAHVAIELRIPESGEVWLDDMIKKANRRDLAQSAMKSMVSNPTVIKAWSLNKLIDRVYDLADEFLKQGDLKG